jgi:hypothetical protein
LPTSFDYPQRTFNSWFNSNTINEPDDGNVVVNCDHNGLLYGITKIRLRIENGLNCVKFNHNNHPIYEEVELEKWYMATITISDSARYYLNDCLIATVPQGDTCSVSGVPYATIGVGRRGQAYMDGKIDDVRFYNRALTHGEIRDIYGIDSCNNHYNSVTIQYFVADSSFKEKTYLDSTVTYYTQIGGCDSIVDFYSHFQFIPN